MHKPLKTNRSPSIMPPPRNPVEDISNEINAPDDDVESSSSYNDGAKCVELYLFPSGTSLTDCVRGGLANKTIPASTYSQLTQKVFFPLSEESHIYPNLVDRKYLLDNVPRQFEPPTQLAELYELFTPFIASEGDEAPPLRGTWPPEIYNYIFQAVLTLYVHMSLKFFS